MFFHIRLNICYIYSCDLCSALYDKDLFFFIISSVRLVYSAKNAVGSVISAIVLTVLPEALREVADYRMLVYAIVLILVMQATNNPTMKRFFASAKEKLTPGRKERAAL